MTELRDHADPRPASGHERPGAGRDAVRDAATVVLLRRDAGKPRVLMGRRGAGAAFMAAKYVFPGGAVDPGDAAVPAARPLAATCARRLEVEAAPGLAHALAMAAIRELWEETGLALAVPADPQPASRPTSAPTSGPGSMPGSMSDPMPDPMPVSLPAPWRAFFAQGHQPAADALEFFFRAITPPGRPRRFDARFFVADAGRLAGDPDDFGGADAELSDLRWLTLDEARRLDLPFITTVVLAELAARLAAGPGATRPVPFFHHREGRSFVDPL